MQRSVFLARLIGPIFIVIGIGMVANLGYYHAMIAGVLRDQGLIYVSGLLSLIAGLALVNAHNSWDFDWRLIITVLGWLLVIGGVMRIVLPSFVVGVATAIYGPPRTIIVVGVISIVLGGFLSCKGYWRRP